MTEEIKEMLHCIEMNCKHNKCFGGIELDEEDCKLLLDYITNLQQEKDCLQRNYNDNEQAIQKLIKEFKELRQENETLKAKLEIGKTCGFCPYYDYKSRCEKAIEYITSTYFYGMRSGKTLIQKYLWKLINILNGSDENETNS